MAEKRKHKGWSTCTSGPAVEEHQRATLKKMGIHTVAVAEFSKKLRDETKDERVALNANIHLGKIVGAEAPEKHEVSGSFSWADVIKGVKGK